jgi:hypothetical protein
MPAPGDTVLVKSREMTGRSLHGVAGVLTTCQYSSYFYMHAHEKEHTLNQKTATLVTNFFRCQNLKLTRNNVNSKSMNNILKPQLSNKQKNL